MIEELGRVFFVGGPLDGQLRVLSYGEFREGTLSVDVLVPKRTDEGFTNIFDRAIGSETAGIRKFVYKPHPGDDHIWVEESILIGIWQDKNRRWYTNEKAD